MAYLSLSRLASPHPTLNKPHTAARTYLGSVLGSPHTGHGMKMHIKQLIGTCTDRAGLAASLGPLGGS